MYNNDEIYKRLAILLEIFRNRHHHLAKYLIDNSALDIKFINNLLNSNKIEEFLNSGIKFNENFDSISKMEDYYNSLLDTDFNKKTEKEIEIELNEKLNNSIIEERYEESVRLRDYMKIKGIKRIL